MIFSLLLLGCGLTHDCDCLTSLSYYSPTNYKHIHFLFHSGTSRFIKPTTRTTLVYLDIHTHSSSNITGSDDVIDDRPRYRECRAVATLSVCHCLPPIYLTDYRPPYMAWTSIIVLRSTIVTRASLSQRCHLSSLARETINSDDQDVS